MYECWSVLAAHRSRSQTYRGSGKTSPSISESGSEVDQKAQQLWAQSDGVQRRMISVDNFFVFLILLFFALLLLYMT